MPSDRSHIVKCWAIASFHRATQLCKPSIQACMRSGLTMRNKKPANPPLEPTSGATNVIRLRFDSRRSRLSGKPLDGQSMRIERDDGTVSWLDVAGLFQAVGWGE